ncbi:MULTISPECIES: hypothetical protein [Mycobacterium]|uniref:hypothetical protein n=1 Tax=Mycobacterium TaxID=1763 RepID=UPI0020D1A5E7|nr:MULTISPECIES: hypothetical protein [Mycobacterium]
MLLIAAALAAAAFVLGGCSPMFPFAHDLDHPEYPLSDDQAKAQVIEPARQIVKIADLQDVSGGFGWESCNDQGDPPYRGRVGVSFGVPAGFDQQVYFQQIAAKMMAHGWSPGAPSGQHLFGTTIHKDGVTAIIGINPGWREGGAIDLFGECRNMNNHRTDNNAVSIKDQLNAR